MFIIRNCSDDLRSTEKLIQCALASPDDDAGWTAMAALQRRGTREVLTAARRLCESGNARERELGAVILGELGMPLHAFPEECLEILNRMLWTENDSDVLQAIAFAFGYLQDSLGIDLLAQEEDFDNDLNCRVARSGYVSADSAALHTLIDLTFDARAEVRDWATFGLGALIEIDTEEIREALWARTADSSSEARIEAMMGLALRRDGGVIEPLLKELCAEPANEYLMEAARGIKDPRLLPVLHELRQRMPEDCGEQTALLASIITRCEAECARDSGVIDG